MYNTMQQAISQNDMELIYEVLQKLIKKMKPDGHGYYANDISIICTLDEQQMILLKQILSKCKYKIMQYNKIIKKYNITR